ncbi:unnamed protein product [Lactuca saligna]|uniref:MULE transposase domain-containing protein n=1 Tax=Lactuca saligna TaxID=75948 RepID=A0AA35Z238_LACSI|nr:unnamed protein product [Lactuca saligna]
MFRISKKKDGKWFVDLFDDTHNHKLSMTPTKVMKHRSHAKFHRTMECKSLMVELNQGGLKPSQIKKAINAMKTSNEVDVTSKQCVDVLSEQRKHNKRREFYGLIKHLQDKALVDNDQYYVVDLCSDGCPRHIFWADGRSRDDFTKFGDVVVFDVTYMTNKFKMPFAPFTGVNHHGQSVLFGGALLENEKEETFVWLFEHFLKCMFSKYPKAIITDQDKAMEHLRPYIARYSDFQESYKEWVMSDTIEEFETRWEVIRDKYKLESNCWITDMYNQRVHWAKAFLKDIFLAVQYDKAIASRRAAEEDEDFKTMNSRPVLSSKHPIEAKAGWTLNARYKVGKRSIGLEEMNNGNGVSAYTLWCVRSNFNKVIEQAKDSPSEIENVNNILIKLLQDQAIQKKPLPVENVSQGSCVRISQVDIMPQLFVWDPLAPTNTKGRPKIASRIKSSLEVPKKRTCSYSQGLGHYATSCSKRKVMSSLLTWWIETTNQKKEAFKLGRKFENPKPAPFPAISSWAASLPSSFPSLVISDAAIGDYPPLSCVPLTTQHSGIDNPCTLDMPSASQFLSTK